MRVFAVFMLTACVIAPSQAQTHRSAPAKVHVPPFPVTDLVRIGTDGVVAIDRASARAQLRTDDGDWLPAVKLPLDQITDFASRGSELLISGFSSEAVYAALFDTRLSTNKRWKLDNALYVDFGIAGPRQVTTEFTRALLPDGGLGPSKPLSNASNLRKRMGRPALLETPSFEIICLPKDERKAVDAPASCERATAPPWTISGNFTSPFLCGSWLITLDEHLSKVEARAYDIETGNLVASHAFATPPTLTCVDNRRALAAGPTLTLFALPQFKRVWSTPVHTTRATNRVFVPDVVVTGDGVTYRVEGSNEIVAVSLPD